MARWNPKIEVKWTEKKEHYEELTKDWDWGGLLYSVPFEE